MQPRRLIGRACYGHRVGSFLARAPAGCPPNTVLTTCIHAKLASVARFAGWGSGEARCPRAYATGLSSYARFAGSGIWVAAYPQLTQWATFLGPLRGLWGELIGDYA